MKFFKQAFLFVVGATVVAYEEASKVVKEQRKKFAERQNREVPKAA